MSKEEIEKDKIHLRNLSEDALKCEDNELIGIDAYAVGSIARILQYIQQLETKQQKVKEKLEVLKKEYKEALENNSTKAFILKCQIEILEEIMKGEE